MAEQALIQFRVDKALKQEVASIYEAMGMDLSTALRMFLVRSKAERGLPFPAVLPEGADVRGEARGAFGRLRAQAAGVPEMNLAEINAEIAAARAEKAVRA